MIRYDQEQHIGQLTRAICKDDKRRRWMPVVQEAPLYTIHAGRDGINDLQWWPGSATTFGVAAQGGTVEVKPVTAYAWCTPQQSGALWLLSSGEGGSCTHAITSTQWHMCQSRRSEVHMRMSAIPGTRGMRENLQGARTWAAGVGRLSERGQSPGCTWQPCAPRFHQHQRVPWVSCCGCRRRCGHCDSDAAEQAQNASYG